MTSRHPSARAAATHSNLSACIAAVVAASGSALAYGQMPLSAPSMAGAQSFVQVTSQMALPHTATKRLPSQPSSNAVVVSSCADDGGFDTLRHAVLVAGSGSTIDMSGLACSKITLGSAIEIGQDDLIIAGPGAGKLAIDGGQAGRVFKHIGYGTLTVNDLTVTHGLTTGDQALGGCIYAKRDLTLNRSVVTACTAVGQSLAAGGGVVALGNLLARSSEFSDNLASALAGTDAELSAAGGGVFAVYQTSLIGSVVSGNTAQAITGVAFAGGAMGQSLKVKYSTISENEAASVGDTTNFGGGGGLVGGADTTILSSTIDNNSSDVAGGLFLLESYPLTASIMQSTISSNTGRLAFGAISAEPAVSISNSTIAFNVSGSLANIGVVFNGVATIESSIIVGNGPADVYGAAISGSHNLINTSVAGTILPMDTKSEDPKLQPLAFNGGPTRTHALGSGSPASGTGTNMSGFANDQRGPTFKRVVGGAADIGAFERDTDHIFGSTLEYPLID